MDDLDDLEELLDDYNMELFLGISQGVDLPDRQLQPSPQPPASPSAGSLDTYTLLAQIHHFQGQSRQAGFEPSTQPAQNAGAPPPAPPEHHAVTAATPTSHPHRYPHQDANDGNDDTELHVDTLPSSVRFHASSDDLGAFQKQLEKGAGSLIVEETVSPFRLHKSSDELAEAFPRQLDQGAGSLTVEAHVPPVRFHTSSDELVEAFRGQPLETLPGSLTSTRAGGSLEVIEADPPSLRSATLSSALSLAGEGEDEDEDEEGLSLIHI